MLVLLRSYINDGIPIKKDIIKKDPIEHLMILKKVFKNLNFSDKIYLNEILIILKNLFI